MLELKGITKYYNRGTINETQLFDNFDFAVEKGDFVSVIGSNGSGKTSLLNIICGSIPIDGGAILLEGTDITKKKEYARYDTIGRVFQDPGSGTAPSMTLLQNLSIADNKNKPFNLTKGIDKGRIDDYKTMLKRLGLGLEDKLHIPVSALSGGQRQAVSMVMTTMTPIDFLILDEHTAALDPKTAHTIMALTGELVKEKKLTSLMVTHNLRYALEYGNRLVMMHEGKVIIDISGEEKERAQVDDLLQVFNEISIERGNSL